MTFLELVQEAYRESGASGTEPSVVTGLTGEPNRFVNWVRLEWAKIQLRSPNWKWMRRSFTLPTVASTDAYAFSACTDTTTAAAIARFGRWYENDFKIYLTSSGVGTEGWLTYEQWDTFKRVYKIGTQNEGFPSLISIDPARRLVFGPTPNAIYTVSGDYHLAPQTLAANGDEPEMPEQFHDLIWQGAVRRYAAFEGAPEVWAEMKDQHSTLMRSLEQDQLPPVNFGNPLA